MTKIRMALADSLERDYECSKFVIDRIRVVEKQYDDLFSLAEDVLLEHEGGRERLGDFLAEQILRFKKEGTV